MKTPTITFIILLMMGILTAYAENKTETFIVKGGDCNECKEHIENLALAVPGVSIVDWNKETKELQVVYDSAKTSIDTIQKAIAKGGNDTPNNKADEEAYNRLSDCCKYER